MFTPVVLILHKEWRSHDIRNVELPEQFAGHGDGQASLGRPSRPAHEWKTHRVDHYIHIEPGEPLADDDMALDTLDEDRQHAQTGGLECAHQVGVVVGAAENMRAEREYRHRAQGCCRRAGDFAPTPGALFLPAHILLGLAEVAWRIGMGKAHSRQFHGRLHVELRETTVLAQDQLEHVRRVGDIAITPVGGNVSPVAEVVEALAGEEIDQFRGDLLELDIPIIGIFFTVADQQAGNVLHRFGHAAAFAAHRVVAHPGQPHYLGDALEAEHHRRVKALDGWHQPFGGFVKSDDRGYQTGAARKRGFDLLGSALHIAILEHVHSKLRNFGMHLGLGLAEQIVAVAL